VALSCWQLLLPAPVKSQSDIMIDRMQINIWPEYDRRSILIIYRLSLLSKLRCQLN
jgi:hypothetical protein